MKLRETWNGSYLYDETGKIAAWLSGCAADGSACWSVAYPPTGTGDFAAATHGASPTFAIAQRDARAKLEQLHREACEREGKVEWDGDYARIGSTIYGAVQPRVSQQAAWLCCAIVPCRDTEQARAVAEAAIAKKLELERQAKEAK